MTDDTDDQTIDMDLPDEQDIALDDTEEQDLTPEDDDTEEVEHDGQKYKIPKALKGAMLMQADYTKKTQDLAEMRKMAETELAAIKQSRESDSQAAEIKDDLRLVDKSLKQYENVDWARFATENPAQAQAYMMQYQQLQMQRQQLADGLMQHEQTSRASREQAQQAALALAQADLLQAMPDFNRELAIEISDSTASAYGFDKQELAAINDPRQIRVLRDAMMWRKSQAAATQATKPKAVETPTKTVRPSSKATVNPDKMTTAEWMAYERKRITQKGR